MYSLRRYGSSFGVTAVELLPIHHFVHEPHLVERGLTNYWGYSSIGYLAPHSEYAATGLPPAYLPFDPEDTSS